MPDDEAALDKQGIPRPRCVGVIESCEESGSFDLPAYLDVLRPRLGEGCTAMLTGVLSGVLAGLKAGERYALDAVKAGLAGATPAAQ